MQIGKAIVHNKKQRATPPFNVTGKVSLPVGLLAGPPLAVAQVTMTFQLEKQFVGPK